MSYSPESGMSPEATRRFVMMIFSLVREIEAIGWYEQQMAAEPDPSVRSVMEIAQKEEFKFLVMLLQALLVQKPSWRGLVQQALFQERPPASSREEPEYEIIH